LDDGGGMPYGYVIARVGVGAARDGGGGGMGKRCGSGGCGGDRWAWSSSWRTPRTSSMEVCMAAMLWLSPAMATEVCSWDRRTTGALAPAEWATIAPEVMGAASEVEGGGDDGRGGADSGGSEAEGWGPDISDTRLIGFRILPAIGRRL